MVGPLYMASPTNLCEPQLVIAPLIKTHVADEFKFIALLEFLIRNILIPLEVYIVICIAKIYYILSGALQ